MAFRFAGIASLALPLLPLLPLLAAGSSGCSSAGSTDPGVESSETTEDALSKGGTVGTNPRPPKTLPPKTLPTALPPHLPPLPVGPVGPVTPEPVCSVEQMTVQMLSDEDEALRISLGCGPVVRYMTGASAGILGGLGTMCPDSPAVHAKFTSGWGPSFCNECLTVPAAKVFVFWSLFSGPNCPSGCRIGSGPPPF